jgi:hypothetical protein
MKKLQLFIILLVVIGLMVYADYRVNVPEGIDLPRLPSLPGSQQEETQPPVVTHPNVTQMVLDASGLAEKYRIEKRTRVTALFESFDLKGVANISAYLNTLITSQPNTLPVYVYEIHGPEGQGKISYLNIKLRLIDQIGSSAGINETGNYGYNSLFYNDESNPNTGFLLSQAGDMVFGFKYNKNNPEAFDSVKKFIETYLSQIDN